MPKLRVHNLAMSLDGYRRPCSGPGRPPRRAWRREWVFATRSGRAMQGMDGGDEGIDDRFIAEGDAGIGATIMGRNMFGPIRGPWKDEQWSGWWGDDPPYHHPVFVLTHHARKPITMQGGTTFHFVTEGIEAALDRAIEAAGGDYVRLGGGAATVQQYLRAGLIDEMHIAIVPILLGRGERLFDQIDALPHGYECVEFAASPSVAHARFARR